MHRWKFVIAAAVIAVAPVYLDACGGGGGGGVMVRPEPPPPPTSSPPASSPPTSSPPAFDLHDSQLVPTGVASAQKAGFNGLGVNVGALDTGVDPADPTVDANDASGRDAHEVEANLGLRLAL